MRGSIHKVQLSRMDLENDSAARLRAKAEAHHCSSQGVRDRDEPTVLADLPIVSTIGTLIPVT